jgi:Protein of unknown function (DUF1592)/Protein of unknown function (DUF1588)/Protein of unknown function (DUF1587)/Protein of unknown function (DUF1595)/Protein of unknown function (DUF1585)
MSRPFVVGGLVLSLLGCEGSLVGPRVERPVDPNLPEDAPRELPAPSSRAPRLSHVEYENAVRDLLGAAQTLGVTANFTADNTSSTFDNNGGDLNVTSTQWTDYQTAAEDLARRATLDVPTLTTVAGGTLPTDDRALIAALGRRIYRRELTATELDAHLTLFGEGLTYYPTLAPRLAGARLVLEALFQSPHFLYRLELSTVATGEVIPLSGSELASRLSFGLWQSTPDEALLTAAADGSLLTVDGYTAQVNRMLLDPRARQATQAFHAQLLQQSKFADITRSTNLFPEFSVALRESMKQEQVRFLDDVLFTQQGGLGALFTTPSTYVDQNLADVYGLSGTFGAGFDKVQLTDGRRAGLFTQIGFLASLATSTESDPIHRGVFLNHRMLCAPLPAPPNMVPPLPRPDPSVPKTLRTRITEFTGTGTCGAGCHSTFINPIGFAYEHYDALGRWRDTDNGLPVDARDTYVFDFTTPRSFDGAVELGAAMAEEPMAHRCYTQKWVQFLHGRGLSTEDQAMINRIGTASHTQTLPVTTMLRLLVESESFKTRPAEVTR